MDTEFDPMPVSLRAFFAAANALCSRCSSCPATVPAAARHGECFFHLAQNLRLAHHHRVEAGGHAEQVAHRLLVAILEKMRARTDCLDAKVVGKKTAAD